MKKINLYKAFLLLISLSIIVISCGSSDTDTTATELTTSNVIVPIPTAVPPQPTATPTQTKSTSESTDSKKTTVPEPTATAKPKPTPTPQPKAVPTATPIPPTATPTPTATPAPTPEPAQYAGPNLGLNTNKVFPIHVPADASAKARLVSLGINVPQTGSLEEANHEFMAGLNVDPGYKERWEEVQASVNSVLGAYPNFMMIAYDKSGTDEDIKAIGDKLTELQWPGDTNSSMYVENWTVDALNQYKQCLTGGDTGVRGTSTSHPHSFCIMEYQKFRAYRYDEGLPTAKNHGQLAIHDAHEYFHHYQKAHALERGLDLASDPDNPETTVQAPRWWIEGAAVSFSHAWYKANWESLSFMKDQTVMWYGQEYDLATANIGTVATAQDFKNTKKLVRGELEGHEIGAGCTSDWKLQESEEDSATETRCFSSLQAVAYMAHLTSWKTVWIDIPQDYYDLGFWGSFEKHIGMEKQEFYDAYNNLMTSGDVNDAPPEGWTVPEGAISEYADFLKIVPESD